MTAIILSFACLTMRQEAWAESKLRTILKFISMYKPTRHVYFPMQSNVCIINCPQLCFLEISIFKTDLPWSTDIGYRILKPRFTCLTKTLLSQHLDPETDFCYKISKDNIVTIFACNPVLCVLSKILIFLTLSLKLV